MDIQSCSGWRPVSRMLNDTQRPMDDLSMNHAQASCTFRSMLKNCIFSFIVLLSTLPCMVELMSLIIQLTQGCWLPQMGSVETAREANFRTNLSRLIVMHLPRAISAIILVQSVQLIQVLWCRILCTGEQRRGEECFRIASSDIASQIRETAGAETCLENTCVAARVPTTF